MNQRTSDNDPDKRDIPSFIEPLPPLILNPYMRPKPEKGTNLMELFEEDSECEEPELLQVYLRLKPCYMSSNLYKVTSEKTLITSTDTATAGHGRRTQHNISKMYTFSKIFEAGASQKRRKHNRRHNRNKRATAPAALNVLIAAEPKISIYLCRENTDVTADDLVRYMKRMCPGRVIGGNACVQVAVLESERQKDFLSFKLRMLMYSSVPISDQRVLYLDASGKRHRRS